MSRAARLRRIVAQIGPAIAAAGAPPRRYFNRRGDRFYEARPLSLHLEPVEFFWPESLETLTTPWTGFEHDAPPADVKPWTRADLEALRRDRVEVFVRPMPYDPKDTGAAGGCSDPFVNNFAPLP